MLTLVLIGGVAFLAGLAGSLLGIGGGAFITPALILLFGLPVRTAVGTSLLGITATSLTAASIYIKRRMTQIKLALILETATIPGAALGGYLAVFTSPTVVKVILGIVLVYVSYRMWQKQDIEFLEHVFHRTKLHFGICASFIAGLLSGLVGIGGGVLKTPILHLLLGLPFKTAAATSVFMVGLTSSAGAIHYISRGDVNFPVAAAVVIGVCLGAFTGTKVIKRVAPKYLKVLFSILLGLMAIKLFWEILI